MSHRLRLDPSLVGATAALAPLGGGGGGEVGVPLPPAPQAVQNNAPDSSGSPQVAHVRGRSSGGRVVVCPSADCLWPIGGTEAATEPATTAIAAPHETQNSALDSMFAPQEAQVRADSSGFASVAGDAPDSRLCDSGSAVSSGAITEVDWSEVEAR